MKSFHFCLFKIVGFVDCLITDILLVLFYWNTNIIYENINSGRRVGQTSLARFAAKQSQTA